MQSIHLKAPAKINFRLDVLRKRDDGYHDLRMLMQRIDLSDELLIEISDKPGITLYTNDNGLPLDKKNIVWRAADAILAKTNKNIGVKISLIKNIPVAAGLGGGSSDAAATLVGLNKLFDFKISDTELMKMGVTLGADVPFFIFEKPAIAEGIGDILTPLENIPTAWIVLVNPNIQVSTAWVYQNLGLTTEKVKDIIPLLYCSVADISKIFLNDLERVTIKRFPVIGEIKDRLLQSGALGSLMSGSGATVFGIFENREAAHNAAEALKKDSDWFVAVTKTI
ncbi:MAG: 4-(cytidine 5'-diphospho)-2-C-methyl-D-erythritol kinase [Desulfuromonadales bacterium]|nr:4-(cytidine 5'-diphospho)-2-C-methyl-D-erythritol kinase [Desulfuromonadales bacterium]